ncbi:MAG TPA: YetF domain-containing protein [Pyrinomonadaceae bacterium]
MFFESWFALVRIVIVGVVAYAALIITLRVSGKRTLSKWNAFDFVVTIALGSTLATVLLSKDIVLIEGVLGFGVLVSLQYLITWLSVRVNWVEDIVKSQPELLMTNGVMREGALKRTRVSESEVLAAIRAAGIGSTIDVDAVVLETDGSFSVIKDVDAVDRGALRDVAGIPKPPAL